MSFLDSTRVWAVITIYCFIFLISEITNNQTKLWSPTKEKKTASDRNQNSGTSLPPGNHLSRSVTLPVLLQNKEILIRNQCLGDQFILLLRVSLRKCRSVSRLEFEIGSLIFNFERVSITPLMHLVTKNISSYNDCREFWN